MGVPHFQPNATANSLPPRPDRHTFEAHLILKRRKHGNTVRPVPYPPPNRSIQACFGSNPPPGPRRRGPAAGTPAGMPCSRLLRPLKHAADIKAKTLNATSLRCRGHRCPGCGTSRSLPAGGCRTPPARPAAPRHAPRAGSPHGKESQGAAWGRGTRAGPLPSERRPGPLNSLSGCAAPPAPPRPGLTFPAGRPAPTSPPASGS